MLACVTLPVSVLSNYWEWTTVDVDILKQIKLQHGVQASALVEDRLFLITKEGQAMSEKVWLNNPNILANTNSGLWSSCLSMSGEKYVFPGKWRWKSKVCWSLHIFTVFLFIYKQRNSWAERRKKYQALNLKARSICNYWFNILFISFFRHFLFNSQKEVNRKFAFHISNK